MLSIFMFCLSQTQLAMEINPIVQAGICNDWQRVKELIRLNNYTPNSPESPLPIISFIYHKNTKAIIKLATKYGANINLIDPQLGRTPMTYALTMGYFNICKLLYKLDAQLDVPDCFGCTPQYLWEMKEKSDELNRRLAHGETVALSKLNLPELPVTQKTKRIQKSKTLELLPTQFPELNENKAAVEYQEKFHPVTKATKSQSCTELEKHAYELTKRLQKIKLNNDGTANLDKTKRKQLKAYSN